MRGALLVATALAVASACAKTSETTSTSSPSAPSSSASAAETAPATTASTPAATTSATAIPSVPAPALEVGCDTKGYVAPAGAKPVMTVAAIGAMLSFTLENRGTAPVCVFTHVATDGEHFDWLRVDLTGPGAPRMLQFVDDRDKSAPVSVLLAPGERVTKNVDLRGWAVKRVNGGTPLAAGTWNAAVTYDTSRETWVWAGKLTASTGFVVK